jgi:H+-transporting ATPase
VIGTQIVATLIAVYGFLMSPIGWPLAAMVWGYALILFLFQDRVKILARRVFHSRYEMSIEGHHMKGVSG